MSDFGDPRACYGLSLHRVYMTTDAGILPEPYRSLELLRCLREAVGASSPEYKYYAAKVEAGERLCPPGPVPSLD